MNQESVSVTSEEIMQKIYQTTELDSDIVEFTINEIEEGKQVVINTEHLFHLDSICANSQPSNQENQINPERLSICHRSDDHENMQTSQGLLQSYESGNTTDHIHISCRPRNHLVPSDMQMANKVYAHNRKRSVSNYRMTTENNQAYKSLYLSTDSEQEDLNYDKALEINATSQMAFEHNRLAGIHHELQTIKESPSHNEGMQILGNLGKKTLLTVGQTIASNISICEIAQNDNASSKISESVASKRQKGCSMDDILAVPGPSGFHRNENTSNLCGKSFQSWNQPEMSPIKRKEGEALTCRVCQSKIAKHAGAYGEKNFYECCVCFYNTREQDNLQMHSYTHRPNKFCNICGKEHTEGDSHDGEHTCNVCKKKFQCRTQLNEHFLDHGDYLTKHCWGCSRTIDGHFTIYDEKIIYKCCVCRYECKNKSSLVMHNKIHRPKIFCKICREEYPREKKGSHNSEYTCIVCEEKFQCKALLEDHSMDHKNYFYTHCRVCNREIVYGHKIEIEGKPFYKCCRCLRTFNGKSNLQTHLYIHTDLRLFKCDACGRRFAQKLTLKVHSRTCTAVPYKCEICGAIFPSSDFLDAHCLVKHRQA